MPFISAICLYLFCAFQHPAVHALYLSVIEIEVNQDLISVEVKVFADDLYDSILNNQGEGVKSTMNLFDPTELETYFNQYITLKLGSDISSLRFNSITEEGDSQFVSFDVETSSTIDQIEIKAGYFFELFPTQKNILKLKNGEIQFHHIYSSASPLKEFTFSD